jgi:hypothetical protein
MFIFTLRRVESGDEEIEYVLAKVIAVGQACTRTQ